MKKLYNIFHEYDVDGEFGDPVHQSELIATVRCTEEEVVSFISTYNVPVIYDRPYGSLYCMGLRYEEVNVQSIEDLESNPYGCDILEEFRGVSGDFDKERRRHPWLSKLDKED